MRLERWAREPQGEKRRRLGRGNCRRHLHEGRRGPDSVRVHAVAGVLRMPRFAGFPFAWRTTRVRRQSRMQLGVSVAIDPHQLLVSGVPIMDVRQQRLDREEAEAHQED